MGLFSKPVVECGVCGCEIGAKEKRWKSKDGYVCGECQKPFGMRSGPNTFINKSSESIKIMKQNRIIINEFWSKNKKVVDGFDITRNIENILHIDDAQQKWFALTERELTFFVNKNEEYAIVFDFKDVGAVSMMQGDKVIASDSSKRAEEENTKTIINSILEIESARTYPVKDEDFYISVKIWGATNPIIIDVGNEQSAIIIQQAFATMISNQ